MSRVVHVRENIEGAVYVGRAVTWRGRRAGRGPMPLPSLEELIGRNYPASPWANPYRLPAKATVERRQEVIEQYRALLLGAERRKLEFLPALRGKPLACWCRYDGEERTPANACHADVLLDLLEQYADDELRAMAVQR